MSMSPFRSATYNTTVKTSPVAFAQTISWVPFDARALFYDGINVNYINTPGRTLFHGVPTDINEWQRLDLWSTTTGNNDGYDFNLSDPSIYEVLRHGFKINQKGFHRVTCSLGLEVFLSGRFNVAIQFAVKNASSTAFTRVGAPVMAGLPALGPVTLYVDASRTVSISGVIECNPGDEASIFTTGIGAAGDLYAIKKHCMLRIESLN